MTPEELELEIRAEMSKMATKLKLVEKGYAVDEDGIKLTASGIEFAKSVAESLCERSSPRHDPRLN